MTSLLMTSLGALAYRLPVFLVYGVIGAVAATHLSRHRTVSYLTLGAMLTLGVADVVFTGLSVTLPLLMRENGQSASTVGMTITVVGLISSLVHAVGFGLLGAAVFAKRGEAAPATPLS